MEYKEEGPLQNVDQIYQRAANLLVNHDKTAYEVRQDLVSHGLDEESAAIVVENIEKEIEASRKKRANRDMIFGALWCVGGIVGTMANIGFIFWGAIVFGAVQFVKGAISASNG